MIKEFWVDNFLSIKDKQTIDFTAKGPESELVVEVADNVYLNKLAVLFGHNASGKSNMLKAINVIFRTLAFPAARPTSEIRYYIPFRLRNNEPTRMNVIFFVDGIKYEYHLEFNNKYILNEEMSYYPKKSKALFYSRQFVAEDKRCKIIFGQSLNFSAKTKEEIIGSTFNNQSVLSTALIRSLPDDASVFRNLHKYIFDHYHDIDGDEPAGHIIKILKEFHADGSKRRFMEVMLQKADLNITNFRPISIDKEVPAELLEMLEKEDELSKYLKKRLLTDKTEDTIEFNNYSEEGSFYIPLELQSRGTLKFISILPPLYQLITGKHVYLLDELGEDLHYELLYYYLNVFLFNSEESQLIITSQEMTLLSQDLLNDNRGIVWLVKKDRDTASSVYQRGDSFGLHKNSSLYNFYKSGRLGAKPEIGSFFIDMED